MGRSGGAEQNRIGNIVCRQGPQSLVDAGCAVLVAVESDDGELGLDEAGIDGGDPDSRSQRVDGQTTVDGGNRMLGGAVDRAVGIGLVPGNRSDIDDVSGSSGDHRGDDGSCQVQQSLDVRVDHGFPVLDIAVLHR